METFPISRRLPPPSIHHQLSRLPRPPRIEFVKEHPQRRFLLPPLAENRRPSRPPKRPFPQPSPRRCLRHRHAHDFHAPPLILTHALRFCTRRIRHCGSSRNGSKHLTAMIRVCAVPGRTFKRYRMQSRQFADCQRDCFFRMTRSPSSSYKREAPGDATTSTSSIVGGGGGIGGNGRGGVCSSA